jgi:hypothetical protein
MLIVVMDFKVNQELKEDIGEFESCGTQAINLSFD